MKSAQILVGIMTALILVFITLIAYGIMSGGPSYHAAATQTKTITLPSVSTIQLMAPYKDGIALYVATPKGDFIYFADPKNGLSPARLSILRKD